MTYAHPLDPRRAALCSRKNADRIALHMCETTSNPFTVIRTGCQLQPYRVLPSAEVYSGADVEMQVMVL